MDAFYRRRTAAPFSRKVIGGHSTFEELQNQRQQNADDNHGGDGYKYLHPL
jgi:hypothetical protein